MCEKKRTVLRPRLGEASLTVMIGIDDNASVVDEEEEANLVVLSLHPNINFASRAFIQTSMWSSTVHLPT